MTALDQAFRAAGAAAWGGVAYDRLTPEMTREDQEKVRAQCPQPRTVLVAAFPYYAGDRPGNLSLYARGEDYHRALARRLNTVCDFLSRQYPMESFLPAADNSPLPEREAALPHCHAKRTKLDKIDYPLVTLCAVRDGACVRAAVSGYGDAPMVLPGAFLRAAADPQAVEAGEQVSALGRDSLSGSRAYKDFVLKAMVARALAELGVA